jgi:molybdopterin-guanine dinucleotide biosynthesis protein A
VRAEAQDLDVCLLETTAGLEPLCAVYSRACLEPVRAALDAGERKMVAFHGRTTGGRSLRIAAQRARAEDVVRNLNTPDDWAEFRRGTP